MKKPQIFGNKIVTRYTDANSLVLKSYIDISSQRLSKVRAGSHLASVLKNSSQAEIPESRRGDQMSNFETERDMPPVDQNYLSNRTHDDKQLPLSKFMEQYLNQKGVDANVLSTKEHNIYQFFKEKFDLMGKYLGEDVLKEGLLTGGPIDKAQVTQAEKKKAKKLDMDSREQYLLGLMANNVAGFDPRESQNAKVVRINREIMSQILREEHKKEMDELLKLQTEQNMQVFNDLQDIDVKDSNQKASMTSRNRTPPSKMILKNNFLRTFVNIDTADRPFTSNNQNEYGYTADSWRKTQSIRPVTEQLVFRTKQKREQLIPNVEEISLNLNLHKFGSKRMGAGETPQNRQENNHSPTTLGERHVHDLRIKTGLFESPRVTTANQNLRPVTKGSVRNYSQSIGVRSESVKSLIHEEIEFLKNERNLGQNNENSKGVNFQPAQQGFPQRKIQIFYDTQSEIKKPNIGLSFPRTTPNANPNSSKGFSFNPPKTKSSVATKVDKNKPLVHINPKIDNSAMRSLNRNALTQKHSTKVMSNTTNSPSRWSPEVNETKKVHKQSHYVTKLISVNNKQDNARSGLLPLMSGDLEFNQQPPVNAILKNSFGNKYWRNNFN